MYVHLELRICWGHALCMVSVHPPLPPVCMDLIGSTQPDVCMPITIFSLFLKRARDFQKVSMAMPGLCIHSNATRQGCEDKEITVPHHTATNDLITRQRIHKCSVTGAHTYTHIHTCTCTHTQFILLNIKRQHVWKWLNHTAGNFTAGVPKGGKCDTDLCVMDVISTGRWVVLAAMLDAMLQ